MLIDCSTAHSAHGTRDTREERSGTVYCKGPFPHAIKDRIAKPVRAIYTMKQILGHLISAPIKLYLTLFSKQVEPVLLYGSSVWEVYMGPQ